MYMCIHVHVKQDIKYNLQASLLPVHAHVQAIVQGTSLSSQSISREQLWSPQRPGRAHGSQCRESGNWTSPPPIASPKMCQCPDVCNHCVVICTFLLSLRVSGKFWEHYIWQNNLKNGISKNLVQH